MTHDRRIPSLDHDAGPARLVLVPLLWVLPLFPPETRGESLAGCAVLIGVMALLSAPELVRGSGHRSVLLAGLLVWPLALAGSAPGAAIETSCLALLAGAAGLSAAGLPAEVRRSSSIPFAFVGTGALAAGWAVYQKIWGLAALASALRQGPELPEHAALSARLEEGRAFAAFATPAALGCFLALALPMTVGLALGRRGAARWWILGVALLEVAGLLAAASAGAVAALLLALATWGLWRGARSWGVWLGAGLIVLALAGVIALRGERMWSTADPENPLRLRAGNFRAAAAMYLDAPWLGVGPGAFGEVFPAYRRPGDNEVRHAHNLPLEAAAETGTVGGLLVTLLFFGLFLGPLFRRPGAEPEPPWVAGATVGLAAFALHNLVDFTSYFPSLLWVAALLRGLLARRRRAPAPRPIAVAARLTAAAALAVTLIAVAAGVRAGLAWNARYAARLAVAEGRADDATRLADRATRLAPWDADGWLLRAQLRLGQRATVPSRDAVLRSALADAERAVRLSPARPAARGVRGAVRAALGDVPGAHADLTRAAELYPVEEKYVVLRDTLARRLPVGDDEGGTP